MRNRTFTFLLRLFAVLLLICVSFSGCAQDTAPSRHEVYAGYSYLSNSINGVPGARQSLNGWDASLAFGSWHGLRFKAETFGYSGTNLGGPQSPLFILGGVQFSRRVGRESLFVEGLGGDLGMNSDWGANASRGETASFATVLGGGVDTRLSKRFAYRVSGGFVYENIALEQPKPINTPYRIPGLPNYFGRVSTGLVWRF